jgi:hypothetical protein
MEKILRTCTICGTTARSIDELKKFVTDKKKEKFYFTKATCKKCNADIARQKRAGIYIYKDKITKCKDCGLKPKDNEELESLFVKDKTMKIGYANLCRKCASARTIRHQKNNPEMFKKRQRRYAVSQHNITIKKYDEILVSQGYACAICGVNHLDAKRSLYIDHDHSCCPGKESCGNCIRGLLCPSCNFMIGLSKDNIDNLKHAIMYLNKGVYH